MFHSGAGLARWILWGLLWGTKLPFAALAKTTNVSGNRANFDWLVRLVV